MQNLGELANDTEVINFIEYSNSTNLKLILNFENFKKEDLKELSKNKKIFNLIKKCEENILIKLFELYNIETSKDLLQLVKNKDYYYIKAILKNNSIEDLIDFYNLTKTNLYNKNKIFCDINIEDNNNNLGICEENEKINFEVLNNKNKNYLSIYIDNKLIGIIKRKGEKSFLTFDNIFDTNGNVIFIKGFIYNLEIDGTNIEHTSYFNKKELDLSKINEKITRKPLRKIIRKNNKLFYDNFNDIVLYIKRINIKTFDKN